MGDTLFKRQWRVSVGDLATEQLRIVFKVTKTLEKEPNTLNLKITNLSEASRGKLKGAGVPVIVEAGYEGSRAVIFSGDSRTIDHAREGADWQTVVQCGDGEKAFQYNHVNQKFAPGSQLTDVLQAVGGKLAKNIGNLKDAFAGKKLPFKEFTHGFVGFGRASDVFDKLVKSSGMSWSIQQGALQIVEPGKGLEAKAVLLNADRGLIGSPVHAPPDKKGKPSVLKCKCLLNPQIAPGRVITLDTKAIKGEFICQKVDHQGDSHGNDWFTSIEALARKAQS
jgi:hypothetical protein